MSSVDNKPQPKPTKPTKAEAQELEDLLRRQAGGWPDDQSIERLAAEAENGYDIGRH